MEGGEMNRYVFGFDEYDVLNGVYNMILPNQAYLDPKVTQQAIAWVAGHLLPLGTNPEP